MSASLFWGLLIASSLGLVFLLLDPVTRRARETCDWLEAQLKTANPGQLSAQENVQAAAPPLEETAGYHLRCLLTEVGILGLLSIPLLAIVTPINIEILSEGFSYLLDRRGRPLAGLSLLGAPLTDLHLYGALPTAALILIGGACASARRAGLGKAFLAFLVTVATLLVGVEVLVTGARAYTLAADMGGIRFATFIETNLTLALTCALVELVSGYFVVHRCLIPAIRCVGWLLVRPFQGFGDVLARRKSAPRLVQAPLPARFGRWLDEGVICRLRALDAYCARLLPSFVKEKGHD